MATLERHLRVACLLPFNSRLASILSAPDAGCWPCTSFRHDRQSTASWLTLGSHADRRNIYSRKLDGASVFLRFDMSHRRGFARQGECEILFLRSCSIRAKSISVNSLRDTSRLSKRPIILLQVAITFCRSSQPLFSNVSEEMKSTCAKKGDVKTEFLFWDAVPYSTR